MCEKEENIDYYLLNIIGLELFLSYDFLKVVEFGIDFSTVWKTFSPKT